MNIVSLMLEEVNSLLAKQNYIEVPTEVKEKLVDLGYDPAMGARPYVEQFKNKLKTALLNTI